MADNGWVGTNALKNGGEGYDGFTIVTAQISDGAITAAKLSAGAVTVGKYDVSTYGGATYG